MRLECEPLGHPEFHRCAKPGKRTSTFVPADASRSNVTLSRSSIVKHVPRGWRRPLEVKPSSESGKSAPPRDCKRSASSMSAHWFEWHWHLAHAATTLIRPSSASGLSSNHDLDVLVERRQEVHQAFDGKARLLVVRQRRNLRLRNCQHLGGIALRQLAPVHYLIEGKGEAQLGLSLGGVGKAQIGEHVGGAARDRFRPFTVSTWHSAPHNFFGGLPVRRQDPYPASRFGYAFDRSIQFALETTSCGLVPFGGTTAQQPGLRRQPADGIRVRAGASARSESAADFCPGNGLDGSAIELRHARLISVAKAASASSSTSVSRLSSNEPATAARASVGSARASFRISAALRFMTPF